MLISIITATLNSEKTIEKTIDSINAQSIDDFEYIIVDGKSEDKTLGIINRKCKKKYQLISEKDAGIYSAMNKGIKKSTGNYVMFLNSNDWLNNDTLQTVLDTKVTWDHLGNYGAYAMEYNATTKGFWVLAMESSVQHVLFEVDSMFQYLRTISNIDGSPKGITIGPNSKLYLSYPERQIKRLLN